MSPNEDPIEEEPKESEEESLNEETDGSAEEDESGDELDTQKELDRLRFHFRGHTLEELKKIRESLEGKRNN